MSSSPELDPFPNGGTMSEFHAESFTALPGWSQTMLVCPDIVAVDVRLWISPNRGYWSMATQVAAGLDRELVHLQVGPEMSWTVPQIPVRAAEAAMNRLVLEYTEPFPVDRARPG